MKAFLFLLVLIPINSLAGTGPFGIEQGMKLEEIQKIAKLREINPYIYSTEKLPAGHPAFDEYRFVVTPQHGLCKVVAWTHNIPSNAYGDGVKENFKSLFDAVTTKYGKSKEHDLLKAGSIWNEPQDWMMSLAEEERGLVAFWSRDKGSSLPETISYIKLEVHGVSLSSAVIELGYEFQVYPECSKWINLQRNFSL